MRHVNIIGWFPVRVYFRSLKQLAHVHNIDLLFFDHSLYLFPFHIVVIVFLTSSFLVELRTYLFEFRQVIDADEVTTDNLRFINDYRLLVLLLSGEAAHVFGVFRCDRRRELFRIYLCNRCALPFDSSLSVKLGIMSIK